MTDDERRIIYIYEYLFNRDVKLEEEYKEALHHCAYTRKSDPRQLYHALCAIIRYQEFTRVSGDILRILSLWGGSGGFLK